MHFPVILCKRNSLIVVRRDFFERVGSINEDARQITINVERDGRTELHWILDRDGQIYSLTPLGPTRASLWQKIGVVRRREQFRIEAPTSIEAGRLMRLVLNLNDISTDLPNVSDLISLLANLAPDAILNTEKLTAYFGE